MSHTYVSVVILFLAQILPALGIVVGTEELTTTLQTLLTIGAGLWVLVRRYQAGDITVLGARR